MTTPNAFSIRKLECEKKSKKLECGWCTSLNVKALETVETRFMKVKEWDVRGDRVKGLKPNFNDGYFED